MKVPRNDLLLSVDAGSSGARAVVYDARGQVRSVAEQALPGGREVDAEAVWRAVADAIRHATDGVPAVEAVSVSAQLGLVLLDAAGLPLRPAITWTDARAGAESERLNASLGRELLLARTGRVADGEQMGPKLMWIGLHEPHVLQRASAVVSLKDYLVAQLTGAIVMDRTHASYSLLFDVRSAAWDDELALAASIPRRLLPRLVWATDIVGGVTSAASAATGLLAGIPVVSGGPDGTLGAVGLGLRHTGEVAVTTGTSDVFMAVVPSPPAATCGGLVTNVFVAPGEWAVGGTTTTTGGCLRWLLGAVGVGDQDFEEAVEAACRDAAPGADGLIVLPDLVGERAPEWDRSARGVFFGLDLEHTRAHLVRAVLEGVAYVERSVIAGFARSGVEVRAVRIGGGGARSAAWCLIRADATGLTHLACATPFTTALGGAMLGAVGVGRYASLDEATAAMCGDRATIQPDPGNRGVYDDGYAVYRALRAALAAPNAIRAGRRPPVGDAGSGWGDVVCDA